MDRKIQYKPINEFIQENINLILDPLSVLVFRVDPEGHILEIQTTGHALVSQLTKIDCKHIQDILPPNDVDLCLTKITALLNDELFSYTFAGKVDYHGVHIYFDYQLIKTQENAIFLIAREITHTKKAEILNDVLYTIAINSSDEKISVAGFCKQIEVQLGRLMDVSNFYIAKLDDPHTLTFIHSSNKQNSTPVPFSRTHGNGLSEYIIRTGLSLHLKGDQCIQFQQNNGLDIIGSIAKCWIGTPIIFDGHPVGIIACQSYSDENLFDGEDLATLAKIGGQLGLWLERKKKEESQSSLLHIFEHSLSEIYIFNSETYQFMYANKGAYLNLGYNSDELLKLTPWDLKSAYTRETFIKKITPLINGSLKQLTLETIHRRKNGSSYPVEILIQPCSFNNTKAFAATVIDITEKKESEQKIEETLEELRTVDKIMRSSIENQSLEDLMKEIMDSFPHLASINGGRIYLYDDQKSELILKHELLEDRIFEKIQKRIPHKINTIVPPLNEGTTFFKAIHEHRIIVLNTEKSITNIIAEHSNNPLLKKLAGWANKILKIKTFLIIPLMVNERIFGLITLYSKVPLNDNHISKIQRFTNNITALLAKNIAETESVNHKKFIEDVLNNLPVDIAVLNSDSEYLFINPAAIKNPEMREWIIGKTDLDYTIKKGIGEELAVHRQKLFRKAESSGSEISWTDTMYKDGVRQDILRKYHPVYENNALKYMLGYGVDITKRVSIENKSKELASIVAHSNDAIISVSLEGKIINWNEGAEQLFGYKAAEVINEDVTLICDPGSNDSEKIFQTVLATQSSLYKDSKRMHKSGDLIDVSMSIFPVFDSSNQITSISAILRDITLQKRVTETMLKNKETLKEAMRIAKMGNWEWNIEKNELTISEELNYLRKAGNESAVIDLQTFLDSIEYEYVEKVEVATSETLKTGEPFELIYRIKNTDKYLEIRGKVDRNDQGKIISVHGTAMDVTERVSVEKMKEQFTHELEIKVTERTKALEISQNESKYQLDTLNEIALVSMTDIKGNITYVNDIFCDVSGYTPNELISKNHRLIKSGLQHEEFFKDLWTTIVSGKVWKGEIINKRKDGSHYWVHTNIVPFFDLNGKIEKFVSVGFDITEEKETERKLKESLEKEKELGKLKSRFVSTASHQFRTPMAIIQSNSELLAIIAEDSDPVLKAKFEKVTQRIKSEVKRMTSLMDEILTLGKIAAGKLEARPRTTDISKICTELISTYNELQHDERRIEFITEGKPRDIKVDPSLIEHCISNLLSNALKYSIEGNPRLHLIHTNQEIMIKISDKGIGIPAMDLENLFQPFHRAINVGEIPGTGLGLAIVKEYIELNNGTIEVESRINEGSLFTIILPYPLINVPIPH